MHTIKSSEGTRQGAPLAGFGFCLVLQKFLRQMKMVLNMDQDSLTMNSWFFDDGSMVGEYHMLNSIIDYTITVGPDYGLLETPLSLCIQGSFHS
jgi:hypothetical protein